MLWLLLLLVVLLLLLLLLLLMLLVVLLLVLLLQRQSSRSHHFSLCYWRFCHVTAADSSLHLEFSTIFELQEDGLTLTKQLINRVVILEDDKSKTAVVVSRARLHLGVFTVALQPGLLDSSLFTEELEEVVLLHVLWNTTDKDLPDLRRHRLPCA